MIHENSDHFHSFVQKYFHFLLNGDSWMVVPLENSIYEKRNKFRGKNRHVSHFLNNLLLGI